MMKSRKSLAWAAFLTLLIALNSCAPTRKNCEKNYGPCGYLETKTDTIWQDVKIEVPGATVKVEVPFPVYLAGKDSIIKDTIRVKDATGTAEIKFYFDKKTGKLMAECSARERELLKRIAHLEKSKSKIVYVPEHDKRKGIFIPNWVLYIVSGLALLVFLFWLYLKLNSKLKN